MKEQTANRRMAGKASYEREKRKRDRILIRLDRGQAAMLDAFCKSAGVSRSAFFRRHLEACIAAARSAAAEPSTHAGLAVVADEFDELFSGAGGE